MGQSFLPTQFKSNSEELELLKTISVDGAVDIGKTLRDNFEPSPEIIGQF